MTYLNSINQALNKALSTEEKVLLIGEDITDPYGGAFKVSKGLSDSFPRQVYQTPISESSIIGISIGLAIRGFLPIAEIMFGDFMALCADQLLNTATKFPLMYEHGVDVPIVIRTPMGGGRGYGPTHSQSIEKMFLGMPGLRIISPSIFHNPGDILLQQIFDEKKPTLFIEYKQLYSEELVNADDSPFFITSHGALSNQIIIADNFKEGDPDVIVWTYGSISLHMKKIGMIFKQEEINIRSIFFSDIGEITAADIKDISLTCSNQIIIEEGTSGFNWGSELSSILYESCLGHFKKPIVRLSSKNLAIPASKEKESDVLVSQELIEKTIINLL
jgi:pyruvate/2-oxoglutarate/acetoin dehydrogenase E1 component